MPAQFWVSHLSGPPVPASGTALASSTSLTDISPAPQITVPANMLNYYGATLRLTAFGQFSTTSTPTLLLGFYIGGVAGTALGATAATTTASGASGVPFRAEMTVTVRTTGASGTCVAEGYVLLGTSATAWTPLPMFTATLGTVSVNTTQANTLTLGAQWGTSSSSNTITCQQMLAESVA